MREGGSWEGRGNAVCDGGGCRRAKKGKGGRLLARNVNTDLGDDRPDQETHT